MDDYSYLGRISIFRAEFEKIVIPTLIDFSGRVLDLGCSTAMYKDVFQKEYIGVDLSSHEFSSNNEKDQFMVGIGYNLPFKESTFDMIFCTGVLEHTRYPEKIIMEISRVLKKNKIAFISVPSPLGMRWESSPKFKGFTIDVIKELLIINNLHVIDYKRGGGLFAQALYAIETFFAKSLNKENKEEKFRSWDPQIKHYRKSKLLKIRGGLIDLITSFEIKSGLNNFCSQGLYVWAEKI